jgi:RNA polymerase sigma-70 factor (ECF subfamily)
MGLERVADRRTGMGSESAAVVTRAMHGDHDAFATLIGLATNRLYALACLILRDTDRAEDAAQEAIVRAWRELPRLRDPEKFDAWLRRLTVNACFDEARRVRRRAEVSLMRLEERQTADPAGAYVEHERVDRAFRRLPFDQRTVLVLQHHFDLSHGEIADTLGIPIGTVKSRIRYGSAALRASLDADDRSSLPAADRTSA